MPSHAAILRRDKIERNALLSSPVATGDTGNFMTELRQPQWQFAKSAEAIVEQILAHVLALGEDEDFHLR
jgi:hypothetical protein